MSEKKTEDARAARDADVRALAHRVFARWEEYQRKHPGRSVPVDDTLSRLFELVPEYRPHRERLPTAQGRPPKKPGVFKIQEIARKLETSVSDLLGEETMRAREHITDDERRAIRATIAVLHRLLDLDDPKL